jgi:outer membrane protein TolC
MKLLNLIFFFKFFSIFLSLNLSVNAQAQEYSFSDLWEKAKTQSPNLLKSAKESELANSQAKSLTYHWSPSVYFRGGYFNTNNPGQSLFANLNQRSANPTEDFNPNSLNHPNRTYLTEATIGLALPLYEGGKFSNLNSSAQEMNEAQKLFKNGQVIKSKSELISAYAKLLNYNESELTFNKLIGLIEKQIAQYQLGSKSNPVGYSGLLGLKATLNKAQSFKNFVNTQSEQEYININTNIPNLEKEWKIQNEPAIDFIKKHTHNNSTLEPSLFLKGQEHATKALTYQAESEKSQTLPSLGVFAETNNFFGERDSANSSVYGAYLKWNWGWYNANTNKEILLKKDAEELNLKLHKNKEVQGKLSLVQAIKSLEYNLTKAQDTQKLLNEQVSISKKLFQNGAINAIQLSDLYLNIVDLNIEISKIMTQLIEAKTQFLILNTSSEGDLS